MHIRQAVVPSLKLEGELSVVDPGAVDHESVAQFSVTVTATDSGALQDSATLTIDVVDVNEPPVVEDQSFSVDESSTDGTVVGSVVASDVDAGDESASRRVSGRLAEAGVDVALREGRVRVSPHYYNDAGDVDRLLGALEPR